MVSDLTMCWIRMAIHGKVSNSAYMSTVSVTLVLLFRKNRNNLTCPPMIPDLYLVTGRAISSLLASPSDPTGWTGTPTCLKQ